jgi:hypothetical protein
MPKCDAVTLLILANVGPMTVSGELLVGAVPPTNSAVVSHAITCVGRGRN